MKRLMLVATLLAGTALATPASAAIFTSDECGGGGCTGTGQPGGFASITGVNNGNNSVTLTITPNNGNGFVNGGQTTFTFNLIGNPTITYSGLPTGFTVVGGTGTGGLTQNAGTHPSGCPRRLRIWNRLFWCQRSEQPDLYAD